uniref:Uncharacterized protein n=1 Tax=Manihot esculenta TaxID=3983 RepID=A0A2C9UHN8_MANES
MHYSLVAELIPHAPLCSLFGEDWQVGGPSEGVSGFRVVHLHHLHLLMNHVILTQRCPLEASDGH